MRDPTGHRLKGHPVVLDAAAVLLAIVVPTIALAVHGHGHETSTTFASNDGLAVRDVVALIVFIPLVLLRRRWPTQVVVVGALAAATITGTTGARTVALSAMVVLLFAMASRTSRSTVLGVGGGAILAVFAAAVARLDGRSFAPDSFATIAWFGLALAAGDALRSRRQYIASVEERARQAEANNELETERRIVEERLRIARELHDIVAHHIAVVNVQAGVAAHLLHNDPDGATVALGTVRDAGRSVLTELSGLLNVLRSPDDEAGSPAHPQPTLRQLDQLVASFTDAGLHVTYHSSGSLALVPDAIQLAVFRIVEEALTNAHKYGDGNAIVRVGCDPTAITVNVSNRLDAAKVEASLHPPTGRHGLIGIRERVAAAHGTVAAGASPDDFYTLEVHLPLPRIEPP